MHIIGQLISFPFVNVKGMQERMRVPAQEAFVPHVTHLCYEHQH